MIGGGRGWAADLEDFDATWWVQDVTVHGGGLANEHLVSGDSFTIESTQNGRRIVPGLPLNDRWGFAEKLLEAVPGKADMLCVVAQPRHLGKDQPHYFRFSLYQHTARGQQDTKLRVDFDHGTCADAGGDDPGHQGVAHTND